MKFTLPTVNCAYGAPMGRLSRLPAKKDVTLKLHLVRLRWVDGDYDQGGAYWGRVPGDYIYWAVSEEQVPTVFTTGYSTTLTEHAEVFVRAKSRAEAKVKVLAQLSPAKGKFFR